MDNPTRNTAFPLQWPNGVPRTPAHKRSRSKFTAVDYYAAYHDLATEVGLIPGVRDVVVSTNVPVKRDGRVYSGQREPEDPGVAVFFTYRNGRHSAMSCDRWLKVGENLRALAHTVAALRGIERWGGSSMVDAVFTGFQALPSLRWWEVLEVPAHASTDAVELAYRTLSLRHHPDRNGGRDGIFKRVGQAWAEFQRERGLT